MCKCNCTCALTYNHVIIIKCATHNFIYIPSPCKPSFFMASACLDCVKKKTDAHVHKIVYRRKKSGREERERGGGGGRRSRKKEDREEQNNKPDLVYHFLNFLPCSVVHFLHVHVRIDRSHISKLQIPPS